MDVQAIGQTVKTKTGANLAAAGNDSTPSNAFSALLQSMGARFTASFGLNESKILTSDDIATAARLADAREAANNARDDEKDVKSAEKPKAAKSKDDGSTADDDTAVAADENSTADDATAGQAQTTNDEAAAQAVMAATVALPIVVQTEVVVATAAVEQVAAAVDLATNAQAAVQTVQAATDVAAEAGATDVVAAQATTEVAAAAVVAEGPKVVEKAADKGPALQQTFNSAAPTTEVTDEAVVVQAATEKGPATDKTANAKAGPQQTRTAAAQDQASAMSRLLGNDERIQVQVKVNGPQTAATTLLDASPYNIYSGYTGGGADSTANGQVGQADAGNALVSKSSAEQAQAPTVLPSPNVAPQPQAPTSQQGTATAARADGAVPVTSSAGQASNGQPNGFAFGTFQATPGAAAEAAKAQQAERPAPPTPQQVIDQIKVNITKAAKAGLDRVTIQLKPHDLGRIDVKLEMSEDHKVRVTVTADTKDTLALLQNDSRTLERALNDAGLRTDTNNLHFSLREGSDPRTGDGEAGRNQANGANDNAADDVAEEIYDPTFDYAEAARRRGGVDTFA